jgi:hypothetical protein
MTLMPDAAATAAAVLPPAAPLLRKAVFSAYTLSSP